jgi:hypothetical protein
LFSCHGLYHNYFLVVQINLAVELVYFHCLTMEYKSWFVIRALGWARISVRPVGQIALLRLHVRAESGPGIVRFEPAAGRRSWLAERLGAESIMSYFEPGRLPGNARLRADDCCSATNLPL